MEEDEINEIVIENKKYFEKIPEIKVIIPFYTLTADKL